MIGMLSLIMGAALAGHLVGARRNDDALEELRREELAQLGKWENENDEEVYKYKDM